MKPVIVCLVLAGLAHGESLPRDGFELYYRTLGKGPVIVLLSGGPGFDVDYMLPVAEKLAGSFTCVLLEQRGTGRSRPPAINPSTISLDKVVDDLEALRVHLKLDALTLVGHSWGGMLAMAYAAAYPQNVGRLALVASGGMDMTFQPYFGHNIEARLWPADLEARKAAKTPIENISAILPAYFFDRGKAVAFAKAMPADSLHTDVGAALTPDLARHYNVRESLKMVDRPALIVQGRQDPVGESTAYEIHLTLRGSSLKLIDQCGHFPWIEQPDKFYPIVSEFLAR
jgi:proline iminopeptidase